MKKNLSFNSFTLIELIVVISILSILGLLSLLWLNKWNIIANNAKRVSDITNIYKIFMISREEIPDPWKYIKIYNAEWEIIAKQWLFDESVYKVLQDYFNKLPRDNFVNINSWYYWYTKIWNGDSFEIIWYIQDPSFIGSINRSVALDVIDRIPYIYIYHDLIDEDYRHIDIYSRYYKTYWTVNSEILKDWIVVDFKNNLKKRIIEKDDIWWLKIWWEYVYWSILSLSWNIYGLNTDYFSPALPDWIDTWYNIFGDDSSNQTNNLTDEEIKNILIGIISGFDCDLDNMEIDRATFSWWNVWDYSLSWNTIYLIWNWIYYLTESIKIPEDCVVLLWESSTWVIFNGKNIGNDPGIDLSKDSVSERKITFINAAYAIVQTNPIGNNLFFVNLNFTEFYIAFYVTYTKYINLINLNFYNNNRGLSIGYVPYMFLNNVKFFNNYSAIFIYNYGFPSVSLNNSIIFNNNYWLSIWYTDRKVAINNTIFYNNLNWINLRVLSNNNNLLVNCKFYNNNTGLYLDNDLWWWSLVNSFNKFYWTFEFFDNSQDIVLNRQTFRYKYRYDFVTWATSFHPNTWWSPGNLKIDQNMISCNWVINPINYDGYKLLTSTDCSERGIVSSFTWIVKRYIFWINIPKQTQPYMRSGDILVPWGIEWKDWDSTKYIWG